jgi:adhesin/invasin
MHPVQYHAAAGFFAVTLIVSLAACADSGARPARRSPSELHMASGNDQAGVVGAPLPQPIVVKLIDDRGKPVVGHSIAFEVVGGGGIPTADTATTDTGGVAQVHWILGDSVSDYQRMNVHAVDRASGKRLITRVFRAVPRPRPAARLEVLSGDGQSAFPLTTLPQPVTVRALDSLGRGVPGLPVTFSVVSGAGSVTGGARSTDIHGVAKAGEWTIGPGVGANILFATADGLPTVAFTATGITGKPGRVLQRSGDAQHATVGKPLSIPPSVVVRDEYGNPVSGTRVTFISGKGTARVEQTVVTGEDGRAVSGGWVMPTTSGPQELYAFAAGAQPTVFRASAIADRPAQLLIVAGDANTGRVGTVVATSPSVRVVDRYGNPSVGTPVRFTTGRGSTATSYVGTTDSAGVATFAQWVLGSSPGVYVLIASVPTLGPVEFRATATPAAPPPD